MKRVTQFFSEFFKLSLDDIKKLRKLIKDEELEKLNISTVKEIIPNINISSIDLDKYKSNFVKIEDECLKNNINYITFFDDEYPNNLKNISSIPKVLYYKGDINLLKHEKNIGVVGSRKPTAYGKWITSSLTKELVQNDFCIVSGFANGIDSIAHKTALENGGKTICVFGTPVSKIYPATNKKLFEDVLYSNCLVISEHHPLKSSFPQFFATRNRIISGLSSGVLITEAGAKSGTLITANYALEQGKFIFSVPGNINSDNSIGTNSLIKDGACMVTNIDDILFEYGYKRKDILSKDDESLDDLSDLEKEIYLNLKAMGQSHAEKIAINLSMNIQNVISILNILDIKGYVSYDGFIANCKLR